MLRHVSNLKKEQPYSQETLFKLSLIYDDDEPKKTMDAPVNIIMASSRYGLPDDSWFDLARNASWSLGGDMFIKQDAGSNND